jgi:tRNA nucleotidyltransferase (CCA-adding enzyme)
VLQEFMWHPEGDVFEHSMQAIDAAAEDDYSSGEERLTVISAALCHDLGKSLETVIVEGRIRSTGHDEAGVALASSLMCRITSSKKRKACVVKLVLHHMAPGSFIRNNASDAAYKRLAVKLAPQATCRLLIRVATADMRGRNQSSCSPLPGPIPVIEEFKARVTRLNLMDGPEQPLLTGKDLAGLIEPGPLMGAALKKAYDIQINEHVTAKDKLIKRILE